MDDKNYHKPPSVAGMVSIAISTAFLALIMMPFISMGSDRHSNERYESEKTETVQSEPDYYDEEEPFTESETEMAEGYYPQGDSYNIGVDIPEGYYILLYNGVGDTYGDASWEIFATPDGVDSYGHFQYSAFAKLEGHGYFDMSWCDAYSLDTFKGENNPFEHPGMFRVGIDVLAGTYKVVPTTDQGYEQWIVHEDIDSIDYDKINKSYPDTHEVYEVTLKDGEILEMQFCILEEK